MLDGLAGAATIVAMVLLSPVLRSWYRRWGATDDEVERPLPGDDRVPQPRLQSTRAITVSATAAQVWPWLMQMGQGRGGLYSYDWLENLVGCDIHSASHIMPEFQRLGVGDLVRLGPEGYPFFIVDTVEPARALVLRGGVAEGQEPSVVTTWTFALDEVKEGTTRLIARNRLDYAPTLLNRLIWRVFTDPISFVMERKMLVGIKGRVERAVRDQG
jgi:hypothetical protein